MDAEQESDLIGSLYDAAVDTAGWPAALAKICARMDGIVADISVTNPITAQTQLAAIHNWPDDLLARTIANLHLNPLLPLGFVHPLGEPWCLSRDADGPALRKGLYYLNCRFEDYGFNDVLWAPFSREQTRVGFWGVTNHVSAGAFRDEHIEFARRITPHIRRSLEISGLLAHKSVAEGALLATLGAIAAAAFVVDAGGRVLFANPAAEDEARRGTTLRIRGGRLVAVASELAPMLSPSARTRAGDLVVEDSGRRLHITHAELGAAHAETEGARLILMRAPEPELQTPIARAATLHRLTAMETRVLHCIVSGRKLGETAQILGVARSTAKTHLAAIYDKVGVRRQADLVRRVLRP